MPMRFWPAGWRWPTIVTPARFLETILSGPLDGRRKLLRRLGEAARDPIEELVASALAFEQEEIASLDRFLAWFGQGEVEVKRDPVSASQRRAGDDRPWRQRDWRRRW